MAHKFNFYSGKCTCGHTASRAAEFHECPACGAQAEVEVPKKKPQGRAMFVPTEEPKPPPRALIPKREPEERDWLDSIGIPEIDPDLPKLSGRPTFPEVHMQLAMIIAKRSTCSRRRVGCVIVSSDFRRVLSSGYNGNAAGLSNCCDEPEASAACGCLHAEENAVISCSEPHVTPKIVFVTMFPCKMCAKRLIQLGGVEKVYYLKDYRDVNPEKVHRDMAAAEILKAGGIEMERIVFADEEKSEE